MPICADCREIKFMLTHDWGDKYTASLCAEDPGLEIIEAFDREAQQEKAAEAEVVLGFPDGLELDLLLESENLTWIQTLTAGVDRIVRSPHAEELSKKGVILTNMSGLHRDIIAEHAMAFILNFNRRFHHYRDQQKKQEWNRLEMGYAAGNMITILGLGSIGRELAARARAFGMEVTGVKRNTSTGLKYVDNIHPPAEIEEAVASSDYVVSALPLTSATENMIDGRVFAAMPDESYFINVGRGDVVVEEDLLKALDDGEIAGAGLDVFREEPLPEDSPFYERENVIVTPHVAGSFPDYYKRALDILLENLRRYRSGEEMMNRVNYEEGY